MLKEYTISIVTSMGNREHIAWLVGEGEGTVEIPNAAWSNNSFHVTRTEMKQLIFCERKSEAKVMTPKNMQSWLGRVLAQLPYVDVDVRQIRICLEGVEMSEISECGKNADVVYEWKPEKGA